MKNSLQENDFKCGKVTSKSTQAYFWHSVQGSLLIEDKQTIWDVGDCTLVSLLQVKFSSCCNFSWPQDRKI